MRFNHFDNFVILVTGILRNEKEKILLIKRSNKNKTFKGFWQLPEGKMEFGEQPAETLTREFKEELGCQLINLRLVTAISSVIALQGNSYHLLRIVLETKAKGKIVLSSEHNTYQWLSLQNALKRQRLVPGIKEVLLAFQNSGLK